MGKEKIFRNSKDPLQKEVYREFMEGCNQAFRPNAKLSVGCAVCDKKVLRLSSCQDLVDFSLKKRLSFVKNDDNDKGHFVYDRDHLSLVAQLPDGRAQASARLIKCGQKMAKLPFSSRYIDHGLAQAHLNGWSRWLADMDEQEVKKLQLHVTPLHIVLNLSSESTILRLTQSANCVFRSVCTEECPIVHVKSEKQGNRSLKSLIL